MDFRFLNRKHKKVIVTVFVERRDSRLQPPPSAMPLVFRTLLFGFVTLLVVVFIIDDIAEVEEETA